MCGARLGSCPPNKPRFVKGSFLFTQLRKYLTRYNHVLSIAVQEGAHSPLRSSRQMFGIDSKQTTALRAQVAELKAKVAAISRSQAVIEFQLDGTIIDANENFLTTM